MNRGAWWASVRRVAKSQTQLKRLNMQVYSNADLDNLEWYFSSKFTIFFND